MTVPAGLDARLRAVLGDFELALELSLPPRGATALFGASGSGKTTFLRCVAGLEPNARGRVAFDGEVWFDSAAAIAVPPHRRPIGYVFQEPRLFDHLSVRRNLEFGLVRVPAAERRIALDDVVPRLGIGNLLERRPRRLSGGEKQRVAIARALLTSPRLLLMDEPLAAVDEARKAEFFPYLESLRDDFGVPIVYVSHLMSEVARLADYLAVIDRGRIVGAGPIAEVSSRLDLPLADSEEGGAVLQATVAAQDPEYMLTRIAVTGGDLWVPRIDRPLGALVRIQVAARDVSVSLQRPSQTSVLNVLPATIAARRDDEQGRTLLQLDTGGTLLLARVTRRSAVALDLQPGHAVFAQLKGVAVHT